MRKRTVLIVLTTGIVCAVVLSIVSYRHIARAQQSSPPTWGIPPQSVVQKSPPEKQKLFQQIAQQEATAYAQPHAPKNASATTQPSSCPENYPTEIIPAQNNPMAGPVLSSLTPNIYGSLTITQVQGDIITFTTSQGHSGTFNVLTGAFL